MKGKSILFILVIVVVSTAMSKNDLDKKKGDQMDESKNSIFNYSSEYIIKYNKVLNLDGMTLDEIKKVRKYLVKEYENMNIFPDNYIPDKNIYNGISSGKNWTRDAEYYISRPYNLIILSYAGYATPINKGPFENKEIKYADRAINEIYEGEDAEKWYDRLYLYGDKPDGVFRINTTNAHDAGYKYASVDQEKSKNIDFNWNNTKNNIVNEVYDKSGFYHLGKNGNNLSPKNRKEWLRIESRNEETCIYVKLWRDRPEDIISQQEDIAYVIRVIP